MIDVISRPRMRPVAQAWLPLPPTSNNSYVNIAHGRAKSKALREWEDEAGWTWRSEGTMPKEALREKQVWGWKGVFYFPSHAKRDIDNHTKHIQDLIVSVVFGGKPDDRHMIWCEHRKQVDKRHPGVDVTVYEIMGEAHGDVGDATPEGVRDTRDPVGPVALGVPDPGAHRRRRADGERASMGPA